MKKATKTGAQRQAAFLARRRDSGAVRGPFMDAATAECLRTLADRHDMTQGEVLQRLVHAEFSAFPFEGVLGRDDVRT